MLETLPMICDDLPLLNAEFTAFDLETTGLHPIAAQIVELGTAMPTPTAKAVTVTVATAVATATRRPRSN